MEPQKDKKGRWYMPKQGLDLLKGMRDVFLKRPENLKPGQEGKRMALMAKPWLCTVHAYLWKEKFQALWAYDSPYRARRYL